MKKVSLIFTGLAIMSLVACNEKKEENSTVVVEKEVPAETPAEDDANGTSVSISSDGVEFSTNDDDTQTEVNIDTDKK